jgi:hypothetical protein
MTDKNSESEIAADGLLAGLTATTNFPAMPEGSLRDSVDRLVCSVSQYERDRIIKGLEDGRLVRGESSGALVVQCRKCERLLDMPLHKAGWAGTGDMPELTLCRACRPGSAGDGHDEAIKRADSEDAWLQNVLRDAEKATQRKRDYKALVAEMQETRTCAAMEKLIDQRMASWRTSDTDYLPHELTFLLRTAAAHCPHGPALSAFALYSDSYALLNADVVTALGALNGGMTPLMLAAAYNPGADAFSALLAAGASPFAYIRFPDGRHVTVVDLARDFHERVRTPASRLKLALAEEAVASFKRDRFYIEHGGTKLA